MDAHALHGAILRAARKSGWTPGVVTMSLDRDVWKIPLETHYEYSPDANSVVVIFGPSETVGVVAGAAKDALRDVGNGVDKS